MYTHVYTHCVIPQNFNTYIRGMNEASRTIHYILNIIHSMKYTYISYCEQIVLFVYMPSYVSEDMHAHNIAAHPHLLQNKSIRMQLGSFEYM